MTRDYLKLETVYRSNIKCVPSCKCDAMQLVQGSEKSVFGMYSSSFPFEGTTNFNILFQKRIFAYGVGEKCFELACRYKIN